MTTEPDAYFYGPILDKANAERPEGFGGRQHVPPCREGDCQRRLCDASVLTLDGYGTLIDRESGVIAALMPWLHDVGITAGRSEILRAFSQAECANLTSGISYRDVLMRVHDSIAEFFDVTPDRQAARDFANSIGRWPVHQDVPAALSYLKQHFQLVIVTNADHAVFDITSDALGIDFDAVYTAEDAGCYKPDTCVFSYVLNRLREAGIEKRRVLHVAGSIRFDHVPAKSLGMTTCWIERDDHKKRLINAQKHGLHMVQPDFCFRSLGAMVEAHGLEARAA